MKIEKTNVDVVGETINSTIREKVSKNKGITLVSLVITIMILLVLLGTAITSINESSDIAPYNNMIADITLLEDKILIYYNKYKKIPKVEEINKTIDGKEYYKIDLNKLENITLNYGTEKDGDTTDIYLVNDNLEVYYLKGIENLKTIHHTTED